jgi:hypothetical protein
LDRLVEFALGMPPSGPVCPAGATGGRGLPKLPALGTAEGTWLNAGAAEVQPSGTDRAPSDAARPEAADTVNWGELKLTATGLAPTSSADLTIGNPLANPLPEFAVDPAEPSIETADVSIDADEVVPEARLVPAVSAVLDVDVEVETTRDESGEVVVVDDVAADASACTALGMAIELSDDTVCALVPAVVPAAWVAAAASPATPDELVVSTGAANGAMVEAADDAPA